MERLQQAVLQKVIRKEDIYCNTNPKELKAFLNCIDDQIEKKPFDIVIDGLNVSLGHVPNHLKSQRNIQMNLLDTVSFFAKQGSKVWYGLFTKAKAHLDFASYFRCWLFIGKKLRSLKLSQPYQTLQL